jgi:hypothetical protein
MNEIFRFLFLRPPAPGTALDVVPSSAFGKDLAAAGASSNRRSALKAAANKLLASSEAIGNFDTLALGEKLLGFEQKLSELENPAPSYVSTAIKDAFGATASTVVANPDFAKDRDRLSDNLIAAKLVSRDGDVEAKRIEALLRLMDLISRIAAKDPTVHDETAVQHALVRPTLVGADLVVPRPIPRPPGKDQPGTKDNERLKQLQTRITDLEKLSVAVTRIPPKSFAVPKPP